MKSCGNGGGVFIAHKPDQVMRAHCFRVFGMFCSRRDKYIGIGSIPILCPFDATVPGAARIVDDLTIRMRMGGNVERDFFIAQETSVFYADIEICHTDIISLRDILVKFNIARHV